MNGNLNHTVGFEIDFAEIYMIIRNSENQIIFYEKVTDELIDVTKKYLSKLE